MQRRPDLIYYPDTEPGIRRSRRGRGFSYTAPDGTRIDDTFERKRIEALAVPPAYQDVWICPKTNGYLQATGRDDRQRKQYRYHQDWTEYRAMLKFDHLAEFGAFLPKIRRSILDGLKHDPGDREYAIAAVLALVDRVSMRVGNADYARENGTYGATTLQDRHIELDDGQITFRYTAKGGQKVRKTLRDSTLNRTLSRLDDLPGKTLASWCDRSGTPHSVSSDAINAKLLDLTGHPSMTAKTFRTWNGSVAALDVAMSLEQPTIQKLAEAASKHLQNSQAIARQSYIHPDVIDFAGLPYRQRQKLAKGAEPVRGLRATEAQLLKLLGNVG